MNVVQTSQLSEADQQRILLIWNTVYPAFMAYPDLEALQAYLDRCTNPRHFKVHENDLLQAWLCTFDRNASRWFVMIIDRNYQGKSIGTALLKSAMSEEEEMNAWVVEHDNYRLQDGGRYCSPLAFYLKLGFHTQENRFDDGELQAIQILWHRES